MFTLEGVIGHRGTSAYAPENTLEAFQKAQSLACRCIEFDVMLSADGCAFVFHDDSLRRTTNGVGELGLVSAEYVQSLECGSWFSKHFENVKIPTLRSTLLWLATTDMQANIEIKPYRGFTEQTTVAVLSSINEYWPSNKSLPLISSFDQKALALCRDISPDMPLALLLSEWDDNWLKIAKKLNCFSIHVSKRIVTQARVQAMKHHGFKVCVYTVNRKRFAMTLFSWGVDAVFSDYPDLLSSSGLQKLLSRVRAKTRD